MQVRDIDLRRVLVAFLIGYSASYCAAFILEINIPPFDSESILYGFGLPGAIIAILLVSVFPRTFLVSPQKYSLPDLRLLARMRRAKWERFAGRQFLALVISIITCWFFFGFVDIDHLLLSEDVGDSWVVFFIIGCHIALSYSFPTTFVRPAPSKYAIPDLRALVRMRGVFPRALQMIVLLAATGKSVDGLVENHRRQSLMSFLTILQSSFQEAMSTNSRSYFVGPPSEDEIAREQKLRDRRMDAIGGLHVLQGNLSLLMAAGASGDRGTLAWIREEVSTIVELWELGDTGRYSTRDFDSIYKARSVADLYGIREYNAKGPPPLEKNDDKSGQDA